MIVSPYRTQFTKMVQEGESNPTRSDVNRKALEKSSRKALWQARKETKDAKH